LSGFDSAFSKLPLSLFSSAGLLGSAEASSGTYLAQFSGL